MNDRDTFAAAALTGLMFHNHEPPKPIQWWVEQCYDYADAMLRERGTAFCDNCVTGNKHEMECSQPTLTYDEREAVEKSLKWATTLRDGGHIAATLRKMLERMK